MYSATSYLDMPEDMEYDEVDIQHYRTTLGPRLKSDILRKSAEEMNPMIYAEVLRQDVESLRNFIQEERHGLKTPLSQMLYAHRKSSEESLAVMQGFRTRITEMNVVMANSKEEFPDNPTLVEGVLSIDGGENTSNGSVVSRTEMRHSRRVMMDLLHRPDVLNLHERKQQKLVHSKLGGGIYDAPGSTWDGTRYKNTLVASLRSKLTLKVHFHALVHIAEAKKRARRTCVKYRSDRSANVIKLCFQTLRLEWLSGMYTRARGDTVATMLVQQKYLYPTLQELRRDIMIGKRVQGDLSKAAKFDHWWCLIHGFTKVERFHQLARAQIVADKTGHKQYCRLVCEASFNALHDSKRLAVNLREAGQRVHTFRMHTAGRKKFRVLSRHTRLITRLVQCDIMCAEYLCERLLRRPFLEHREYAQDIREQRVAIEAGVMHRQMTRSTFLLGTLLHFHRKRQALRKWHIAAVTFHNRKRLAVAMHRGAAMASYCQYLQTCMDRASCFYSANARQDALVTLKLRVKRGTLHLLGGAAAAEWRCQHSKRRGLQGFKQFLAYSRRSRLVAKWSLERSLRGRMTKAYQAWIYAYVKKCALRVTLEKKLLQEKSRLADNPQELQRLRQAGDWREEMTRLGPHHKHDADTQELEHSLTQLRAQARTRVEEARTVDFSLVKTKLRAIRSIGAPQRKGQEQSALNVSIQEMAVHLSESRGVLDHEEEEVSGYVQSLRKHKRTRKMVESMPLCFMHTANTFAECASKNEDGVISAINVGPGVRSGFAGIHATGVEAAGTLADDEVRTGMQLMLSGLHEHHVQYQSHLPQHHDSHHLHHHKFDAEAAMEHAGVHHGDGSAMSSIEDPSDAEGLSRQSAHALPGGHSPRFDATPAHHSSGTLRATLAAHGPGEASTPARSRGGAVPVHGRYAAAHRGKFHTPHTAHSTGNAHGHPPRMGDTWAHGEVHSRPPLHPKTHHAAEDGAGYEDNANDVGHEAPHHPLPPGMPHYLQATNASEAHSAQAPHPLSAPVHHAVAAVVPSSHLKLPKPALVLHESPRHRLPPGVPHYLQATNASEAHSAQAPHPASAPTPITGTSQSRRRARAVAIHGARKSTIDTTPRTERPVDSITLHTEEEGRVSSAKRSLYAGATRSVSRTGKKKVSMRSTPSSSMSSHHVPHAQVQARATSSTHQRATRAASTAHGAVYEEERHRVRTTEKEVRRMLSPSPRRSHHKEYTEHRDSHSPARGHEHSAVHAKKVTHLHHHHVHSSSPDSDMDEAEITRVMSKGELYRNVDTSTSSEDSAGGEGSPKRSKYATSPAALQGTPVSTSVWARGEDEVRTDMGRAATTTLQRRMNKKDQSSLLRFFRNAVALGTARKQRRHVTYDTGSSSYLDEDDEDLTDRKHAHGSSKRDEHKEEPTRDLSSALRDVLESYNGDADDDVVTGGALLERSIDMGVTTGTLSSNKHAPGRSLSTEHDTRTHLSPHRNRAAASPHPRGISQIEDDEDDVGTADDADAIIGHDSHTQELFRDPEGAQRHKLEMYEVTGTIDEALRLVKETHWAFSKLRRHAFLSRSSKTTAARKRRSVLAQRFLYWRSINEAAGRQLVLCDAMFRRQALSRAVRQLHYFGYTRLQKLRSTLSHNAILYEKRRALLAWWKLARAILNGMKIVKKTRVLTLRRSFAQYRWAKAFLPGMGAVRHKVTRRVCAPLVDRWRVKTRQRKHLRGVFALCMEAWEARLEVQEQSGYRRQIAHFAAWREYVGVRMVEKADLKKLEMAYVFRGLSLTSKYYYGWLEYHGRAQAVKRATLRKKQMKLRLVIDAIKNEALETRLALQHARHHRTFFMRLHSLREWRNVVRARLETFPRMHHRLKLYRLFFDEMRVAGREWTLTQTVLPKQQDMRMIRLLNTWKGVVIRRMRIRIGLSKVHDTWLLNKARGYLVTWPGRESFAKGEAMRTRLEEQGRARIVLVKQPTQAELKQAQEAEQRKKEEAERKARSFIEYRQRAPIQQRAQLMGIIYSMDDAHAVAGLFDLMRTVLAMWSDTAHSLHMNRGRERLVTFRHKRFLLEHHLRKWMNRCSATSHRAALWIQAKYREKHVQSLAEETSAIATQKLVEQYAHMDVEPGLHTLIMGKKI